MTFLRRAGVAQLLNRRVTKLQGADASRFIQAILTNDMKLLTHRGSAIYGGFLNSKGRVVGDCNVLQLSDDAFLLDYDEELSISLIKHWKRYKLRMKVAIEDVTDAFKVYSTVPALVGEADTALVPSLMTLADLQSLNCGPNTLVHADPRGEYFGVRAIVQADCSLNVPEGYEVMNTSAYLDHHIALGIVNGEEIVDGIPLECNLDLMQGISYRKGCYVGQELTARTQYKGNIRKRLVPLALIPSDRPDVIKKISELAFRRFDDPSHGELRAFLADSKGWEHAKAPSVGNKILNLAEAKTVGTILSVAQNLNCVVAMMRLGTLRPSNLELGEIEFTSKFQTQDGSFHAVPYQPSWWPQVDWKTGKMVL
ncbi:hypothetical protein CCR75_008840 [Bremia lactucae]|uniref:GCVT N-terminal domain-containing protein n=1 Tax=Bremia lactucae TaxID=4779 RepID=A0A976IDG8_BRELC|nr:hypothetical protein CCR75_008840 [Bremia lactucae]